MSIITRKAHKSSPATQPTTETEWTPTPGWFLSGKAQFTVSNGKGQHYSYQILKKEDRKGGSVWMLTLLSGPDNNRDFQYVGVVGQDGSIKTTRNGKVSADSRSFKVAAWALRQVWSGKTLPAGYEINHKGFCGRCGRALTRPEGVSPKGYRFGYGETCYRTILMERAKLAEVAPEPTAEQRAAEAVAIVENKMRAADHAANRFESWGERFERINREEIEAQEAGVGINPLY